MLSAARFGFMLRWALRLSLRYADYCTLVTVGVRREYVGLTVDLGSRALSGLADLIQPTIRETDLIGGLEDGQLGLLLSHSDRAEALRIIQRFADTLGQIQFSTSLAFAIGAACCPTNGVDMDGLVLHAMSHPVVNVRGVSVTV